uniref:Uncharacterized protein n=1 Tax=Parascaris equorum TaxID=6256 RepID=A0A914SG98_PAREQ
MLMLENCSSSETLNRFTIGLAIYECLIDHRSSRKCNIAIVVGGRSFPLRVLVSRRNRKGIKISQEAKLRRAYALSKYTSAIATISGVISVSSLCDVVPSSPQRCDPSAGSPCFTPHPVFAICRLGYGF